MAPTGGGGGGADDDDDSAFAEAMRGARPLPPGHPRVTGPPRARPRRKRAQRRRVLLRHSSSNRSARRSRGARPTCPMKLLRELRAGAHAVEAQLDLHGRARAEALRGWKVRVTAGRASARAGAGDPRPRPRSAADGPCLRPAVWQWLASAAAARAGVMAFTSARPRDGGPGATLVLLRRAPR
jgi:DNA-nicking Smr family endonuclease